MPGSVMFWVLFTCLACVLLGVVLDQIVMRLIWKVKVLILVNSMKPPRKRRNNADS